MTDDGRTVSENPHIGADIVCPEMEKELMQYSRIRSIKDLGYVLRTHSCPKRNKNTKQQFMTHRETSSATATTVERRLYQSS